MLINATLIYNPLTSELGQLLRPHFLKQSSKRNISAVLTTKWTYARQRSARYLEYRQLPSKGHEISQIVLNVSTRNMPKYDFKLKMKSGSNPPRVHEAFESMEVTAAEELSEMLVFTKRWRGACLGKSDNLYIHTFVALFLHWCCGEQEGESYSLKRIQCQVICCDPQPPHGHWNFSRSSFPLLFPCGAAYSHVWFGGLH